MTAQPFSSEATQLSERSGTFTKKGGIKVNRVFTKKGVHPFDEVEWELRSAIISDEKGKTIFEQKEVEVPKAWSQTATNIVVSKYFHGVLGTEEREHSVKQLIYRVAHTMSQWGKQEGYFDSDADVEVFEDELTHLLLHQKMAFNSPVWFNVGVEARPQCSACFINSVNDSMESILDLAKTEGMLFKFGSGTGTNFSALRSSKEKLSGGGTASGPVSFMRGYDSFAGVIKSGGRTRRAAKMVILDVDHPDVVDFIKCKAEEEKKAWALIEAGFDGGFNVPGGAYDSIQFQNANHSVRVSDEFMQAVLNKTAWTTTARKTHLPMGEYQAEDLLKMIAEATWVCGDPGMQFDTTINHWHTCPNTARINASNPCSEYMYLDDSACNLASLNLMKFRMDNNGELNLDNLKHAIDITILAQEIIVDNASYPTKPIERNSLEYRPLGLGYANLGALLMSKGLPYDSEEGRNYAAAITALVHGEANLMSAKIAQEVGPFRGFARNRESMLRVMRMHQEKASQIHPEGVAKDLMESVQQTWASVNLLGEKHGFRNGQVSVLAPTGTIGFMMDCDTTGVEPDIALVKYKKLVGGGVIKIVNQTVPEALKTLQYSQSQIKDILDYINIHDTIEGAPHLHLEHLNVFDCAFKPMNGVRSIHYMGHIRMMAAVQPFLSGAISKTVNLPHDASVDDIMKAYLEAWQLGLKAIAIYRDGCKGSQPLSTSLDSKKMKSLKPIRRRLPDEREAITHKFSIAGHEGYLTVGKFEDGTPGELFIVMSKEGSTVSGLMDSFATAVSLALQYGVPLKVLVDKFSYSRYEPSGFTGNAQIRMAKSITDYIFRWLALKFLPEDDQKSAENLDHSDPWGNTKTDTAIDLQFQDSNKKTQSERQEKHVFVTQSDAPPCPECGSIMVRNAACYKCLNCGTTSGCS